MARMDIIINIKLKVNMTRINIISLYGETKYEMRECLTKQAFYFKGGMYRLIKCIN